MPESNALISWEGVAVPQEHSRAVSWQCPRPPLPRSEIGQYLEGNSHNSWTSEHLGTCSRDFSPGRIAGVFKLPHQQGAEPGACHPCGPLAVVKVDVFPKMHPSHCAPNVWTSKATTKKPYQKLERLEGCWCWDLRNVLEGGISARPWSWKALVGGEVNNVPPASNGAG